MIKRRVTGWCLALLLLQACGGPDRFKAPNDNSEFGSIVRDPLLGNGRPNSNSPSTIASSSDISAETPGNENADVVAGTVSVDGASVDTDPLPATEAVRPKVVAPAKPIARVVAAAPLPPIKGRRSWAIERVRCAPPNQARILFVSGRVTGTGELGGAISLRPERRYHMNFDRTAKGTNAETDICIPTARFCYGQKDFASFGGSSLQRTSDARFAVGNYASSIEAEDLAYLIEHNVWRVCRIAP